MMRAPALLAACLLMLPFGALEASAQPALEARLTSFTPWLAPDDTLNLSLRVTNTGDAPARDLRVSIAIHEAVETRSHLVASFDGLLGTTIAGDTVLIDGEIAPGSSRRLSVRKPLDEISFFRFSRESRAYPVRLTVLAGFERAPPIDTHMVLFPDPPSAPLRLAVVVPLQLATPPYAPDGTVAPQRVRSLTETLDRLEAILETIDGSPGAPITLAPSGMLLSTLSDLSDGYTIGGRTSREVDADAAIPRRARGVLDLLEDVLARPGASSMLTAYSGPFLPDLGPVRVQAQFSASERALEEVLDSRPARGWFLPSPPFLDEQSLTSLENSSVRSIVVNRSVLSLPPTFLTHATPFVIETRQGREISVLPADESLAGLMDPPDEIDAVVARQRLLADSAAIMLERPAVERVATLIVPADAPPDPILLGGLLEGVSEAPWLRGVSLLGALREVETASGARLVPISELDLGDAVLPRVPPRITSELSEAVDAVEIFAEIEPDPNVLSSFEHRLLLAESAGWSGEAIEEAQAFAASIAVDVRAEMSKFRAPQPQTITLTSRRATIPLTITSEAEYPAEILIRLDSNKLTFPTADPCPRAPGAACIRVRLDPLTQTFSVDTLAEDSGTFPLRITLLTPTSGFTIDRSRLAVRSTAYNQLAVGITVGAGAFLFVWWSAGIFRQRVARRPKASSP